MFGIVLDKTMLYISMNFKKYFHNDYLCIVIIFHKTANELAIQFCKINKIFQNLEIL